MKKIFLFLLSLLTKTSLIQAQEIPFDKMDKIHSSKEIIVYKTSNKIKKGISHGNTYKHLLSIFGKSSKKDNEPPTHYEDEIAWHYLYEGAEFGFTRTNKIVSFSITSSDYYVNIEKNKIRIGDNISTLSEYFPLTYQNKSHGNMVLHVIDYGFLYFSYDTKTSRITEIALNLYY